MAYMYKNNIPAWAIKAHAYMLQFKVYYLIAFGAGVLVG